MPASSCVKCSKPLAVLSPGRLCPECAAVAETIDPTTPGRSPTPEELRPTPTPPTAASTVTADPLTNRVPFPHGPPGYDLLHKLGSGGMGAVYLAREQAAERLVAMKFLLRPDRADALDRFLVELRVLAKLDHPNIVRVFSNDFLRDDPFFTMEYMPGGSLLRALESCSPMLPSEAVRLVRVVADAVAAAHQQGIIHRDLKPSNILLTADGTPKVSDFSLAKRLDRDDGITRGTGALGTPSYMPPEQISRRNGEIGPWSDVYGLGATLYYLLVGRAPFVGETSEAIIPQVLVTPPTRPRSLRSDIPPELEGVVLKCLEKEPKARYQTMQKLVSDLDCVLAGQKPVAPPLTRWRRVKRWVRANRRRMTVSVLAILLLGGAFALGTAVWEWRKPEDPLKVMQKELAAGREVVLIPQKGKPKWHRWVIGSPEIGTSPTGDGSCSIEAVGRSMLELCPDPMTDHYRLRAEIRFVETKLPKALVPKGEVDTDARAGVYFGQSTTAGNNETTAYALFVVSFDDTPRFFLRGGKPQDEAIQLRRIIVLQQPAAATKTTLGSCTFTPATSPGPWRMIEIEVMRTGVRTWWREPNGRMTLFADVTAEGLQRADETLGPRIAANVPNHGIVLPKWTPRMPIGVLNDRAAIDIRNVTLTPLP